MATGKTTLSRLTYEDLRDHPAWAAIGDYSEVEDAELVPVDLDDKGRIPEHVEEVWCHCVAVFADDTEHPAVAMCRGDSSDGPLLWSVRNGNEDVPLLLPPAPPMVLEEMGPGFFARKFERTRDRVFPLVIKVSVPFVVPPETRRVELLESGPAE